LLSNGSLDKLERTIVDWVCNHIGKNFTQQIKIRFEAINSKDVCAIDVKKSAKKAWLQNNTPDSFLNGSVRLSELVVQGSSHFIKVSSAPNLEKKILLTAG